MTPHALKRLDHELTTFVETLTAGLGRPERRTAMSQYLTGLLLDGERKSIDLIGLLREKTKGNLEGPEERLIEQALYDLRLRYLEVARDKAR
jgi:hypothetical protein